MEEIEGSVFCFYDFGILKVVKVVVFFGRVIVIEFIINYGGVSVSI